MNCYPCTHCNKCGMFNVTALCVCAECGEPSTPGQSSCARCGSTKTIMKQVVTEQAKDKN